MPRIPKYDHLKGKEVELLIGGKPHTGRVSDHSKDYARIVVMGAAVPFAASWDEVEEAITYEVPIKFKRVGTPVR